MVIKIEFISTGCENLDKILGGGLKRREVTLVYGEPGTGKTSLSIQCALSCARKGLKVIFIDSEHTFSPYRLTQIAGNEIDEVSSLILIFKPQDFRKQSVLIEELYNYNLSNIALVLVDTITSLYRIELVSIEKTFDLNIKLNWQLAYLNELARTFNTSILLTSQVRSTLQKDNGKENIEPVANRILKFWSQKIVNLKFTSKPALRAATLEKGFRHNGKQVNCMYILEKSGLIDFKEN